MELAYKPASVASGYPGFRGLHRTKPLSEQF